MWYWVFNVPRYNPITYVSVTNQNMGFGGDFDKSGWTLRMLQLRAEKRNTMIEYLVFHLNVTKSSQIYHCGCWHYWCDIGCSTYRYNPITYVSVTNQNMGFGGDFDKSGWRMLHGAEKRDRIIRTWPNHHKYMGSDIIDVILGVQRTDTTLSHMFLLPTRTWDLGGILTNRVE